jgi:hypothetical protein
MSKREENMGLIRKISGAAFGISFLMAIVLFTDLGRGLISLLTAKYIFIGSGAVGLMLNLLTFQSGKHNPIYNLVFWGGSVILFIGMTFLLMRWPYGFYIIIGGLIILGGSFFLPSSITDSQDKNSELLDD